MQLGTNDLPFQSPLQVGSELEDFVRLLHDSYEVKFVCVCQTIRQRSFTAFNKNVDLLTRLPTGCLGTHPLRDLLGS